MKTHIKTKNMEMTEAIDSYISTKTSELEKFINQPLESVEAWVEVGKNTNHHKNGEVFEATIDIKMPGKVFRAKEAKEDLYVAINEVKDELQREIRKYKEKQISKKRKGSRMFKSIKNLFGNENE